MSLTYQAAVEQTITAGEQIHQIVNGTATTEVTVEDGSKIPSVRKALIDNFYFKDPIAWQVGQTENVFNQLRQFTDGSWWYAPSATTSNPISMGSTPVGDSLWKIYDFDAIGKLEPRVMESLRRSYAEAGYNLVSGSFETGGTLVNVNDVLLQKSTGKAFSGPTGTVVAGTDPATNPLFVDESRVFDRNRLPRITDFGAVAGEDCTAAFIQAIQKFGGCYLPPTTRDKPYRITSDINLDLYGKEITLVSDYAPKVSGLGLSGWIDCSAGGFIGGSNINPGTNRIRSNLKNIGFTGSNVVGTSLIGGGKSIRGNWECNHENIVYFCLEEGAVLTNGFNSIFKNIQDHGCYKGLHIGDANSVSIHDYLGEASAYSLYVNRDCTSVTFGGRFLFNVGLHTEIALQHGPNVSYNGQVYFEAFATSVPGNKLACIRLLSTGFSNKPLDMRNVYLSADSFAMKRGVIFDTITPSANPDYIRGAVKNLKFRGTFTEGKVSFGAYDGASNNIRINLDLDSCYGLTEAEIVNPPAVAYRVVATSRQDSVPVTSNGFLVPISNGIDKDNARVFSVANRATFSVPGAYDVTMSVTVSNPSADVRSCELAMLLNGAQYAVSTTTLKQASSGTPSFETVQIQLLAVEIPLGANIQFSLRNCNGSTIHFSSFGARLSV